MACEHKNLRAVGDRLFCKDCKEELPIEYLLNAPKPGKKAREAEAAGKAPARKRTAKKAE